MDLDSSGDVVKSGQAHAKQHFGIDLVCSAPRENQFPPIASSATKKARCAPENDGLVPMSSGSPCRARLWAKAPANARMKNGKGAFSL
jgi:hypothetical protein